MNYWFISIAAFFLLLLIFFVLFNKAYEKERDKEREKEKAKKAKYSTEKDGGYVFKRENDDRMMRLYKKYNEDAKSLTKEEYQELSRYTKG